MKSLKTLYMTCKLYLQSTIIFTFQSRIFGHYGEVSVTIKTLNGTATRGLDYLAPVEGTTVIFVDDQTEAHARIPLIDDEEMEMEESFSLVLSGVQGGAKLGQYLIMPVRSRSILYRMTFYLTSIIFFVDFTKLD